MNLGCLVLVPIAFANLAMSQVRGGPTSDADVRDVIARFVTARQNGNREAVLALTHVKAARFSLGGTRLGGLSGRSSRDRRKISYFIRHVEFLRPDVAIAVGLWRDTAPEALHSSGAFTYTLVQDNGAWQLATVQDTLIQPLPTLNGSIDRQPAIRDGEWEILFDGKTAGHWLTLAGANDLGGSWRVADGCLVAIPDSPGADLRSFGEYRSFELTWAWKAAKQSNSGVKYRLFGSDLISFGLPRFATGWEYQMADDAGDPGARVDDRQKSGALYGLVAVSKPAAKPAGEWNESRLIVFEDHAEHWLNGLLTARYPVDVPFDSPIVLQHHSSEVSFRNIRVRRITTK